MKLVNLTDVTITFETPQGVLKVKPFSHKAYIKTHQTPHDLINIDGHCISIDRVRKGDVVGLPEPQEGIFYIVDVQAAHVAHRRDVVWKEGNALCIPETAVLYQKGYTSEILRLADLKMRNAVIANILGITPQAVSQSLKRHQTMTNLTDDEKGLIVDVLNGLSRMEGIPYKFHLITHVIKSFYLKNTKWDVDPSLLCKKLDKMTEAQAKKIYRDIKAVGR